MKTECDHIKENSDLPKKKRECNECVKEGAQWTSLRQCLTCGHVGCCDSSEKKHATKHFHDLRHPVMQSYEKGDSWKYCYVHQDFVNAKYDTKF
ncbi:UBP-type zinc finger domain-containing protein [Candidatus Micrarchaeota archaeon]|nr:UBP-type zinc finger domain-containing protein [Candidatus Micrarchaeota archaeon]